MSSKRRTKIEIIHDMLKAIQDKGGTIKPTHLLYKSNLSHKKMVEYIEDLKAKEMISEIEVDKGNKNFKISEKGLQYISDYKKIRQFSDAFGIDEL